MATATDILTDAFGRIRDTLAAHLTGLDGPVMLWRPDPDANPIGWIAWHLIRVQDDHLAGVGEVEQVWTAQGFAERFDLPYPVADIGYGQTGAEVGQFAMADPDLLLAYHDAVHEQTLEILRGLDEAGYARIVDRRWSPPVTAAVRLVSVVDDAAQHVGQIGYLKGMAERL